MRACSLVLAISLLSPAIASAQSPLDEAQQLLDDARFQAAVTAFDRAAEGDALDRDGVIALLVGRALAYHGMRNGPAAERDLAALVSLGASIDERAPPALQRAYARLAGETPERLAVTAEASRIPDGFRIVSRVEGDVASLVRTVRVHVERDGSWSDEEGRDVSVVAGSRIRFYADAIGPGGAVLASAGSRESPLEASAPVALPAGSAAPEAPPASDDPWPWIGLGIGVGVAAIAVAVVLAIVLGGQGSGLTQVSAPMELP